jgi:hypothetical protein
LFDPPLRAAVGDGSRLVRGSLRRCPVCAGPTYAMHATLAGYPPSRVDGSANAHWYAPTTTIDSTRPASPPSGVAPAHLAAIRARLTESGS